MWWTDGGHHITQDGTWGGNLELQALSLHLERNIVVHQAGQRPWVLQNHKENPTPLHVAYHGAEHYNSVRCADDDTTGVPPKAVHMAAGTVAAGTVAPSREAIQRVVRGTGVWDEGRVVDALEACGGDVDQVGTRKETACVYLQVCLGGGAFGGTSGWLDDAGRGDS